jgi:hypothetical protein
MCAAINIVKYRLQNPEPHRERFQQNCFVAVPEALPVPLVERWRKQAQAMTRYARTVTRREAGFELAYRVVTGEDIRAHWQELFAFYNDDSLLDWIRIITDDKTTGVSPHIQSALNLNILDSKDCLYRWHFDAVSYTAILYLTDVRPQDGGALRLVANCEPHLPPDLSTAKIVEICPSAGTLVLMDGTRCYHSVTPMLQEMRRFSIPLVFPNSEAAARPLGLDSYLYDTAA